MEQKVFQKNILNKKNISIFTALLLIVALTVSGLVLYNHNKYNAYSSKLLFKDANIGDVKTFISEEAMINHTGPLYFPLGYCNILQSSTGNLSVYGFRYLGGDVYEFSPMLTNAVRCKQRMPAERVQLCGGLSNGGGFVIFSNENTSPYALQNIKSYVDPDYAKFGAGTYACIITELTYKDGTKITIKLPDDYSDLDLNYEIPSGSNVFSDMFDNPILAPVSLISIASGSTSVFTDATGIIVRNKYYIYNPSQIISARDNLNYYLCTTQYSQSPVGCYPFQAAYSSRVEGSNATFTNGLNLMSILGLQQVNDNRVFAYFTAEGRIPYVLDRDVTVLVNPGGSSSSQTTTQITELTNKINDLTEKVNDLQGRLDGTTNQINQYSAEINSIKSSLTTSGIDASSITSIQNSINGLRGQINQLTTEKTSLLTERSQLQQQIRDLQTVITNNSEQSTQEKESLLEQIRGLNDTINNLNIRVTHLQDDLDDANSVISTLESEMLAIKVQLGLDPDATHTDIINKIRELQETIRTYEAEIKEIGETLGSGDTMNILVIQDKANDTVTELNRLKEEIQRLKDVISQLPTGSTGDMIADINKIIEEFNNQRNQLNSYQSIIANVIRDLGLDSNSSFQDILDKIASLKGELNAYKDTINNINASVNIDSSSSLSDSEAKVEEIMDKLNTMNNKFTNIRNVLQTYVSTNPDIDPEDGATDAVNNFINLYNETRREADTLLQFLDNCRKLLNLDSNATTGDVLQKIKDLQLQLREANRKIDGYEVSLNKMSFIVSDGSDIISTEQSAVVADKVKDMRDSLLAVQSELNTLRDELKDITGTGGTSEDVAKMKADLEAEIARLLEKISLMTQMNTKISEALGLGKDANLDSILHEITNLHNQVSSLQSEKATLSSDLTQAIVDKTTLSTENKTIKDSNEYLKNLTDEQLALLLSKINQTIDSRGSTGDISLVTDKLETIATNNSTISNSIVDMNDRLTAIENKLDELLSTPKSTTNTYDINVTADKISDTVTDAILSNLYGGGYYNPSEESNQQIQPTENVVKHVQDESKVEVADASKASTSSKSTPVTDATEVVEIDNTSEVGLRPDVKVKSSTDTEIQNIQQEVKQEIKQEVDNTEEANTTSTEPTEQPSEVSDIKQDATDNSKLNVILPVCIGLLILTLIFLLILHLRKVKESEVDADTDKDSEDYPC